MIVLAMWACLGPVNDSPTDVSPTNIRPGPPLPPGVVREGNPGYFTGEHLAPLTGIVREPAWIVTSPTTNTYGYESSYVTITVAREVDGSVWPHFTSLVTDPEYVKFEQSDFADDVQGPGDVTGNGWGDVAIAAANGDVTLVEGLFRLNMYEDGNVYTEELLHMPGAGSLSDAPCGDLVADETVDLCVSSGIFAGPLETQADVVWHTRWTTLDPLAVIHAGDPDADGRPGLWLWAGSNVLWHVDDFPQGEVDPSAVADLTAILDLEPDAVLLGNVDLTGDGRDDLVTGEAGQVRLWEIVDGELVLISTLLTSIDTWSMDHGDFDGDGAADLVVGGDHLIQLYRGPLSPGVVPPSTAILWAGIEYPEDRFGWALAVQDHDEDGRDDLAVGAPDSLWSHGLWQIPCDPCGAMYVIPSGGL